MSRSRILIVEDEPALLRGLRDTFVTRGFEVITAQDGETGREFCQLIGLQSLNILYKNTSATWMKVEHSDRQF